MSMNLRARIAWALEDPSLGVHGASVVASSGGGSIQVAPQNAVVLPVPAAPQTVMSPQPVVSQPLLAAYEATKQISASVQAPEGQPPQRAPPQIGVRRTPSQMSRDVGRLQAVQSSSRQGAHSPSLQGLHSSSRQGVHSPSRSPGPSRVMPPTSASVTVPQQQLSAVQVLSNSPQVLVRTSDMPGMAYPGSASTEQLSGVIYPPSTAQSPTAAAAEAVPPLNGQYGEIDIEESVDQELSRQSIGSRLSVSVGSSGQPEDRAEVIRRAMMGILGTTAADTSAGDIADPLDTSGTPKINGIGSPLPSQQDLGGVDQQTAVPTIPIGDARQDDASELRKRLAYAEVRRELAETEVQALKSKADTPRRAAHRAVQKTISIQEASFRKGRDELQQEIDSVDSLRRQAETKALASEQEKHSLAKQCDDLVLENTQLEAYVKRLELQVSQLTEKLSGCEARISLHVRRIASEEARRQHIEAQLEVEVTRRRKLESEALSFEAERTSLLTKLAESQAAAQAAMTDSERRGQEEAMALDQERASFNVALAEAEVAARDAKSEWERRQQIEAQNAALAQEQQVIQIAEGLAREKEQAALRDRLDAVETQATLAERRADEETKRRERLEKELAVYMKAAEDKQEQGTLLQQLAEKLTAAETHANAAKQQAAQELQRSTALESQLQVVMQDAAVQDAAVERERKVLMDRLAYAEATAQTAQAESAQVQRRMSSTQRSAASDAGVTDRSRRGYKPGTAISRSSSKAAASDRTVTPNSAMMLRQTLAEQQGRNGNLDESLEQMSRGSTSMEDDMLSRRLASAEQQLTMQASRYGTEVEELTRRLAQVQLAESVQAKSHARDCEDLLQRLAVVDQRAEAQASELQATGLLTGRPSSVAGSGWSETASPQQQLKSPWQEATDRSMSVPPHQAKSPLLDGSARMMAFSGGTAGSLRDRSTSVRGGVSDDGASLGKGSRAGSMASTAWQRNSSQRDKPTVDLRAFTGADIPVNAAMADRHSAFSNAGMTGPQNTNAESSGEPMGYNNGMPTRGSSPTGSVASSAFRRNPKAGSPLGQRVDLGRFGPLSTDRLSTSSSNPGRGIMGPTPTPTQNSSNYLLAAKNTLGS